MNMVTPISMALAATLKAAPAAPASVTPGSAGIMDIRVELPDAALPPFSATALLLCAVAIGLVMTAKLRKAKTAPGPDEAAPLAVDRLTRIREDWERGELPENIIFERLAALIGTRLVAFPAASLTTTEIISAADRTLPDEVIAAAAALLQLCDQVRFGALRPEAGATSRALAEARLLLERLPGDLP